MPGEKASFLPAFIAQKPTAASRRFPYYQNAPVHSGGFPSVGAQPGLRGHPVPVQTTMCQASTDQTHRTSFLKVGRCELFSLVVSKGKKPWISLGDTPNNRESN